MPLRPTERTARTALLAMLLSLAAQAIGCVGGDSAGGDGSVPEEDAGPDAGPPVEPEIHVGVPDEETGIRYVALPPGGDIVLESYGQGGLHAVIIVQIIGFGNQAWVDLTVRNLGDYDRPADLDGDMDGVDGVDAGVDDPPDNTNAPGEVMTVPWRQPRLLACDDLLEPVVCNDSPRVIMLGALTGSLDTLDGLHVEVQADVRNRDGIMLTTTADGYLRR